jgi:hypothetical protein
MRQTVLPEKPAHLLLRRPVSRLGKGWEDNTEKSIMPAKGISPVPAVSDLRPICAESGTDSRLHADFCKTVCCKTDICKNLVPHLVHFFSIRSLAASTRSQPC